MSPRHNPNSKEPYGFFFSRNIFESILLISLNIKQNLKYHRKKNLMASFSYIHWPYDVTNPIMHSLQPNYFTKDLKKLNLELSTIEQALSIWPEKTTIVSEAQAKLEIESVTRLIDGLGID